MLPHNGRRYNAASLAYQVREQLRIMGCLSVWRPAVLQKSGHERCVKNVVSVATELAPRRYFATRSPFS
jgi:hypothetical protein